MNNTDNQTPRTLGDHTWHDRAACRSTTHHQVDPDLFFPEPDEMDLIRAAKALCAQCPVRGICLDAALENGDRDGIRGGMTEEERDPLHRKFQHRLNYGRVNAALAGRDIHLTDAERQAVVRAAYQAGTPAERLARLLKVTDEHAQKLYRRTRREIRNRAVEQQKHANKGKDKTNRQFTAMKESTANIPSRDDLGTAA
ncbi:transcriptional regulator WhiB [Streptomyces glebosus]|uniref:Transcriptional regulator WhiB n=1 Tax=Streptomyces glebosus TaxID=249580 RepID=A0A640T404_9ACTN|nr:MULTISPECIES: WhiB family transcriptional regulator [Streptomyces]KOG50585.1 transcription factor WhiB [Streptomyces decoyicus]QZY15177.1 WhiB family transcriptional regulator [Streptomyces decoyicus]GFE17920.1 transcriptional regulator WhiB [Streptomyces glebosus]GHG47098.1 transcriptional regulator WhiB [Streptomyces glebosus]